VIMGPLDRNLFKPYEVRRFRHERIADETHGFWSRVGRWVGRHPARIAIGSIAVLLFFCAGLAFYSTDLTTNDSYRTKVESVEGQDILARSFPAGASAPTDIVVPDRASVPRVRRAVAGVEGVEGVSGPVAEGDAGVLIQAVLGPPPYSTDA
jgi:putative drug exporter of the RND superfamily